MTKNEVLNIILEKLQNVSNIDVESEKNAIRFDYIQRRFRVSTRYLMTEEVKDKLLSGSKISYQIEMKLKGVSDGN